MKYTIILLGMLLSYVSHASEGPYLNLSAFGSSLDDGEGVKFGLHGGTDILWAVDYSVTDNLGGISAAAGKQVGQFKVLFGLQWIDEYDGDNLYKNIEGERVKLRDNNGDGYAAFIEAYYGYVFARAIAYHVERDWDVSPIDYPYDSGTEKEDDAALWIGVNYPFD